MVNSAIWNKLVWTELQNRNPWVLESKICTATHLNGISCDLYLTKPRDHSKNLYDA